MTPRPCHTAETIDRYRADGWWTDDTVDDLFRGTVDRHPDRIAVIDPPNKPDLTGIESRELTWAELDTEVWRFAAVLLRQGLRQGDVVMVQMPNTVEYVTAYLAAWRLGLIVSPVPVQYREHEFAAMATAARARAIITICRAGDRRLADDLVALRGALADVHTVLAFGSEIPAGAVDAIGAVREVASLDEVRDYVATHPADPNDCLTICWTSGTTSTPKGVPRCHYDWLAVSRATTEAATVSGADVMLNPFPMVNMASISGMLLPWLLTGCVLVQHHPFDLPTFLTQIARHGVTYTVAPPALLAMLLQNEALISQADLSSLRLIGSGSAPLQPWMVRGWQDTYGIGIINFFGSNEGLGLNSTPGQIPDPTERACFFPRYGSERYRDCMVGRWTDMKLVDPVSGEEITQPGVVGELRFKSPTVFGGYLDAESVDSPFDEDGYLRSGDLFSIAGENDEFLLYADRSKDLIIRGGMNIAPAELEGLIAEHPSVRETSVVGYPDDVLGERVRAVVVLEDGASLSIEDLTEFLRERKIASYKLPERLDVRDELPRNALGKILKRDLRTDAAGVAG
ncbi:2,3-dihydroxybenzoate-AMP ligase [Rhodococcus sp. WMMA185]|uniref:class I adenylate-forming enzyme family protein n=1 Tax=Rhodococcus sp. WMMA185 TaxID=679318 RepID=UPI000879077C|nr:class I adenylate-forming enzyme family protein [Rhodococcus sp. WMMA185]AOW93841.1 2,3-dihydroxybenzoate-AMP ligase [Rhodococcus sp. WMMA185]